MIQKPLRIGFIGTGPRGTGVAGTCVPIKELRITALCDKFEPLVRKAAATLGDPDVKIYTDHRKLLKEAPIDAVYVVVAPEHCADLVVEALEAGKHVISEVPMAFTLEECWRIVLAVEKSGLKYQLGEQVRYQAFIAKWRELNASGQLGRIVYGQGEYLHGMNDDRYYLDPVTGAKLTLEEAARHPNPKKSRIWQMRHPIYYLPHELSPLLRVLDDRVTTVVCMGTRPPSHLHGFLPNADVESAVMRTAKDAILHLTCGFTVHHIYRKLTGCHWYRLIGTRGSVETHRSDHDQMKWLREPQTQKPDEVWWEYDANNVPAEALQSGHGGADYWPAVSFAQAVLNDTTPDLDVYKAAETAAPAILAAQSAELDGVRLEVPDFRPGPQRAAGQAPATMNVK